MYLVFRREIFRHIITLTYVHTFGCFLCRVLLVQYTLYKTLLQRMMMVVSVSLYALNNREMASIYNICYTVDRGGRETVVVDLRRLLSVAMDTQTHRVLQMRIG